MIKKLLTAVVLGGGLATTAIAWGQAARTISVVVPFGPGGPIDTIARVVTEDMQKRLGRTMVVVNRPGGSGIIAVNSVAQAAPDGSTLFFSSAGSLSKTLLQAFPFEFLDRMQAVAPTVINGYCLFMSKEHAVGDLRELVASAKRKPGAFAYGAQTATTTLGMEMFKSKAGVDLLAVQYAGGSAQARTALLSNEIQLLMDSPGGATAALVKSNRLAPLACAGTERDPSLPEVPTFGELGYPDVVVFSSIGFWAPKDVDAALVRELEAATRATMQSQEVKQRLETMGFVVTPGSGKELLERTRRERAFFDEAARIANYQPR
ncbi:MAG: Bug family tripartite tricarboxylate transporter substrate binding protein [Burkholderiaceae bacterium]